MIMRHHIFMRSTALNKLQFVYMMAKLSKERSATAPWASIGINLIIPRVVEVKPLDSFHLWVCFQDGIVGTIELVNELWGPMFEPLKNPDLFLRASVNSELETVAWPNGADLAPEILY
jgi:hypothetical protein